MRFHGAKGAKPVTSKKKKTTPKARKPYTPPVVTPASEAKPAKAKKKITEFLWHGIIRYRCSTCGFDAASEGEAYMHYQKAHVIPAPRPVLTEIDTGLVSPGGDKIVRIEEVENGED